MLLESCSTCTHSYTHTYTLLSLSRSLSSYCASSSFSLSSLFSLSVVCALVEDYDSFRLHLSLSLSSLSLFSLPPFSLSLSLPLLSLPPTPFLPPSPLLLHSLSSPLQTLAFGLPTHRRLLLRSRRRARRSMRRFALHPLISSASPLQRRNSEENAAHLGRPGGEARHLGPNFRPDCKRHCLVESGKK